VEKILLFFCKFNNIKQQQQQKRETTKEVEIIAREIAMQRRALDLDTISRWKIMLETLSPSGN
jgi:hypothetical protein